MATPRSHKRHGEPATLMSLGDDMLAEIIGRLPSLPSLARAAFVCRRLRNVVSSCTSSSVGHRITRPAPLLGYFLSVIGGHIPSFHRALLRSDREVASIVRRGDFQLADFEDYNWRLMDGRHGLLLLTSDHCMAVFDPVASSRLRIPHCMTMSNRGGKSPFHCFILTSDATSFRVLCLESTAGGRVRPHVYSSCTGEWCAHSLSPKGVKPPRRVDPHSNHNLPMHAGGSIYWRTHDPVLTSFNIASMEFSHLPLPDGLGHLSSYAVGDTEDGTTCIVAVSAQHEKKLDMRVWFLKEEKRSWEQQFRVDTFELDLVLPVDVTRSHVRKVYDVTAGVVMLSVGYKHSCIRYVALRLKDTLQEAGAIETSAKRQSVILADFCSSSGWLHPYFMEWPRPSLKAAGSSIENASTSECEQEATACFNKKTQV